MNLANRVLEFILLIVALTVVGFSSQRIHRYKEDWVMLVPILTIGIHTALFYAVQLIAVLQGLTMSELVGIKNISQTWSLVLRLHTLWTLLIIIYININCKRTITWMKR